MINVISFKIKQIATKIFAFGMFLFILLGHCSDSFGQVNGDYRSNVVSGNWGTAATWQKYNGSTWATATAAPAATNNVTIQSGHTITMNSNPGACNTLTINGTLAFTSARTLAVSGSLVVSGGIIRGTSTGIINVAGIFTVPVSTTANIQRVTLTITGATTINGSLTFATATTGTKSFYGLVTVNSGGSWACSVNPTFTFRGGITNYGSFNAGAGTSTFNTNSQSIGGSSALSFGGNVAISGTITISNNNTVNITSSLTGSATGSAWINAANSTLNVGSALLATGTLTASANPNTVSYNGSIAQTIKPTTYYNLDLSGSLVKTITGLSSILNNFSLTGFVSATTVSPLSIGGNLSVGGGTTLATGTTSTYTLLVGGTTSVTGTLTLANTGLKTFSGDVIVNTGGVWNETAIAAINMAGNLQNNASFTANTGLHTLSGSSKSISGAISIPNLTVSGAYTNSNTLSVTTAFTVTGSLTQAASANLNIGGTLSIANLIATASGNTVSFNGSVSQTIPAFNYYNLTSSSSGARILSSTSTIGIAGAFTSGTNAYTITSSLISFNGSLAQFIPAFSFNTLDINNSAGVSLSGVVNTNSLSFTSGILTTSSINTLTVTGTLPANISGYSPSKYINGPLSLTLPAGLINASYIFPIGKSAYNALSLENTNTTSGGSVVISAEVFDANCGGTAGVGMANLNTNRYWNTSFVSGSGNFTNAQISLTETGLAVEDAIGQSATLSGAYDRISNNIFSGNIIISDPTATLGYFAIGEKPSITIAATTQATEGGSNGLFTITTSKQFTVARTINITIAGTATNGTDYSTINTTVNFPANQTNVTLPVTVTNDNLVEVAETVILTVETGTGYAVGIPSVATVTITDNDIAGVNVSPTSGLITTEAGGTASFTMVLSSQPTANVTVNLSSSNTNEGNVSPSTITFTPANWNTAQTITASGVNDFVADGNIAYTIVTSAAISSDVNYNGLNPSDVAITNNDNDVAGFTVFPTSGLTTTEAGGTANFSIVLTSQPTANVSIGLSSNNTNEGSISTSSLTFTSLNWNVAQNITVTGVNDFVVDGNIVYSIVTAAASSSDLNYNGLNPSDVSVTNTDNDVAGITVSPVSGLNTSEAGGTAAFTVVLNSQPTANVSIAVSSNDLTEGSVAVSSLVYTTANWSTPQTVTITGVNDLIADGNIAYTIVLATAVSTDANYNGINPSDVSVTNNDNDIVGITVNPTSGLVTTEAGGTAVFSIVLNTQPLADVSIGLSSSNTNEGTVSPASLTFTNANWNTPRTVTATGVNDFVVDGNIAYTIVTAAATSTDAGYNGLNPSNVTVTNNDNDVAGFIVTPTSGLTTTEAGGTATFTVALTSQPTANVTINLSSSNTNEGSISPTSFTFTSANWNTAQTATITGVNDFVVDGNIAYSIVTAAATSSDLVYNALNPSDVSVTNNDNDVAGINVSPVSGLTTTEAGGTATFTIVLNSQPTANVSLGVSSNNTNEGSIAISSLTFTSANWNTAQLVTVTGVNDFVVDGNIAYSIITTSASSTDLLYNGINPSDVSVTNTDNDVAGITLSPLSGLVTTEAGGTATFTMVLTSQPTANVAIAVSSSNTNEGSVSPSSLIFTSLNWNTPRTVTITGVNDFVVDGNISYSIITAAAVSSDLVYNALNPSDVSVSNTDNDVAGINVSPISGLITSEAGGTAFFTVSLNSQPTANVSIGVSSSNTNEGSVSTSTLIFTSVNWNTPQTVIVTGVDDYVIDGSIAYSIITAAATSSDGIYNGMNPSNVSVTNTDNDVAGITTNPASGLTTAEDGTTDNFTIVLNTIPTANVSIALSSSDLTEGIVSPASVLFTAANWNIPQTVTITGIDDFEDDGDISYSIVTAAAVSTDVNYSNVNFQDVGVVNSNNDIAGITINPISGLTTSEAGGQASFTMVLDSKPIANVSINLSSDNTAEGSVSSSSVSFNTSNWNIPQTITVIGVDDYINDGDINYNIITAASASTDPNYNGMNASDVQLINIDNDVPGISVSPIDGLITTETGGTASFTVVLLTQPTATVAINLLSNDISEGTALPSTLSFTKTNWATPQTVIVTGVNDTLLDGDKLYTIVTDPASSSDIDYSGFDPDDVTVSNTDLTPSIGGFSPTIVCYGSGASIVITGTHLNGATSVKINNISAAFVVNNPTQITATLPATATTGTISIVTPAGTAASATALTINPLSVGGSVSGGSSVCYGNNSGLLTLSGYTGSITKWQSSISPFSSWSDISNTAATYTAVALTQTTQFRAVVTSGVCSSANTATTTVTVTALPVASFTYPATPYCSNASNPSPTFSGGGVAGIFSSSVGLNFVSTATGQVNLLTTTAGTYTVTNTIAAAGGCGVVTSTSTITIKALPVATIAYSGSPYCFDAASVSVTQTGSTGGSYSALPAGLTINAVSGLISPASSSAGTYTVTYTIAAAGGCSVVNSTTSLVVSAAPIAPTLSAASPLNGTIICAGFNTGTVTATGGSGGSTGAANEYQYSINGGNTYSTYTNGAAITTTAATTSVIVQARRTGGSICSNTAWTTLCSWPISTATVNPSLNIASPASGNTICAGYSPSATITAGSGGSNGAADLYQYSINNGTAWSTYTSAAAITTAGATTNVLIRVSRSAGSYGCSATGPTTIVTWPVSSVTVNPTLNIASPASASTICAGYSPSATIIAGSGGSNGAADLYQYSINNGTAWSTYTSAAAITTTGATTNVLIRVSRSAGSYGCSATGPTTIVTWPVSSATVNPTLNIASPASASTICAGYSPSATITLGSGGSNGAADLYQYSINNGTAWSTYTSAAAITTTGATTNVLIRVSRSAGSYGCSATGPTTIVTWPVSSATVNPTLNIASPASASTICAGYSPSASITAGSGGSSGAVDTYQYSINNGTSWSTYTSASAITTTGATTNVLIRVSRSAGSYGCSATGPTTIVTWPVSSVTVNPTLNIASPASGTTICAGYSPNATITAGSGGSNGSADLYEYSINNGTNWFTYTSGSAITTTGATTNVLIRVSRSAGSYGCSATGPTTIVTWPVSSVTVNPTLNIASPATGSSICVGFSTSATITAGSGGSSGAADLYQYSINNGSSWSTYTSALAINTTTATTNVLIRASRSAGSYGCSATGPTTIVTWPVSTTTVNPTLNTATPASGSAICVAYSTSATITAGSGGSSGATDLYEYSINNGTSWSAYISGASITTTAATSNVLIRVSRSAGSYGCSASGPTTIVNWSLSSATVNPVLNLATPASGTVICAGFTSPNATISSGSGGSTGSADLYEYSINNGGNWLNYTSGTAINTASATTNVLIRVSRSAGSYGCNAIAAVTIATWPIVSVIANPSLNATTPSNTFVTLSWTNPSNCYDEIMIVAKALSSISSTPSGDGTAYTANLAFGSGTAFGGGYVVYKGIVSPQTVTGLSNGTLYYFKFFTRKGTLWSSGIETSATPMDASLASDYYRSKATGNWNTLSSWESSHNGSSWISATLIPGSAANTITVLSPHIISVTASVSIDQATVNAGGQLTVNSGQTLTIDDGTGSDLIVNGILSNAGFITTNGTLVFGPNSSFVHAQNGGVIPSASWDVSSTCLVSGITTTGLTGLNQVFGNFTWNCASQTSNIVAANGNIVVNGNFTMIAGTFTVNNSTSYTITILGNYLQTGGIFDFNRGISGSSTLFLGGNLTQTSVAAESMTTSGAGALNGIIIFNGATTQTLSLGVSNGIIWVIYSIPFGNSVQLLSNIALNSANGSTQAGFQGEIRVNGTFDMGTFVVNQAGGVAGMAVFTLNSGANLITSNVGGISGSISSVNMTTNLNSAANYEFRGAATGTFATAPSANTVNNLIINSASVVALTNSLTVSSTLTLTSGSFSLGANTITLAGTSPVIGSGNIDASSTGSTVVFSAVSAQSIPTSLFYNDNVYNLTVNNANNLSLFGNMKLLNTLTTTSGKLDAFTNSTNVSYAGTSLQTIETNQYLNEKLYNLTIDNAIGVTLNANFTVSNTLLINSGKHFIIPSIRQLTVNGTLSNNAGTSGFILQSDASGTASLIHNTANVAATAQRYINGSAEAWHFLSSPVATQSISGNWTPSGSYGNGTGYDLYLWNEASNCWIYKLNTTSVVNWNTVHPSANFAVGRGYLYSAQALNPTDSFVGNLNNASLNYLLTFNSTDVNLKGFNFVGNPYPSSVDWQAASGWSRSMLQTSGSGYDMWIYNKDASNYGVCNSVSGSGTNGVSRYIAPMQGYFVRAASSALFGTDNTVRVHNGAGGWLKNAVDAAPSMISMVVKSAANMSSDEVRVLFGYADNQSGAAKLFSPETTAPSLYIPFANQSFSVRYLTDTAENPMLPIMFKPGADGKYSLHCNFILENYKTVMLEDRQEHYIQNMKAKNTYSFQSTTNDNPFRFILHFGADNKAIYSELPARIYSDGSQLIIDLSLVSKETEVFVYDDLGRILQQTILQGGVMHKLTVEAKSQILVVQLINPQGNLSKKLFFNNRYE